MSRDLAPDVPARQLPEDTWICGYTDELSEVARQVRNQAFRDRWGWTESTVESWQHWVSYGAFRPEFSFLATVRVDAESPTGALSLYERTGFTRQNTSVTVIKEL